jgi:NAD-dependent dihydropyrimidine dehydrogenase PreA subunit
LEACPRKAIYKREEDGIVLIDQERCQGYRYCIKACPYKKIYFNEVTGKSEKCIFCYPRLEKGLVNACAAQCPGRIRFVGILDDPESPTHKLVVKHKVALGLFPERGTSPNVYYVPPFNPPKRGNADRSILADPRLPLDYLKYLFGPEVVRVIERLEGELARAQKGEKSEVLQLLIGRDASVRYKIVPKEIRAAAPADVRGATNDEPAGPPLTHLGKPGKDRAEAFPDTVREAFGVGLASSQQPIRGGSNCAPSACGGCSLAQACESSKPPVDGSEGPWF